MQGQLDDYWRLCWLCCETPNFKKELGASVITYLAVDLFVTVRIFNTYIFFKLLITRLKI